eukprot:757557-Hanusia_phi.AAC.1
MLPSSRRRFIGCPALCLNSLPPFDPPKGIERFKAHAKRNVSKLAEHPEPSVTAEASKTVVFR